MYPSLHNPVFAALCTDDSHLGTRTGNVAYYDAEVSPFAGFPEGYQEGFNELHALLPAGRRIIYARPDPVSLPPGWSLKVLVPGLQFVYEGATPVEGPSIDLVPLTKEHVPQMLALTALTRPGPFDTRTIDFGPYFGVFAGSRLVAMTGQRMHPEGFSEISAVCTHPDFLGRGYAAALMQQQLRLMQEQGAIPFLHVRADNKRAIALYERLGFRVSRPMQFYFFERSA